MWILHSQWPEGQERCELLGSGPSGVVHYHGGPSLQVGPAFEWLVRITCLMVPHRAEEVT